MKIILRHNRTGEHYYEGETNTVFLMNRVAIDWMAEVSKGVITIATPETYDVEEKDTGIWIRVREDK